MYNIFILNFSGARVLDNKLFKKNIFYYSKILGDYGRKMKMYWAKNLTTTQIIAATERFFLVKAGA